MARCRGCIWKNQICIILSDFFERQVARGDFTPFRAMGFVPDLSAMNTTKLVTPTRSRCVYHCLHSNDPNTGSPCVGIIYDHQEDATSCTLVYDNSDKWQLHLHICFYVAFSHFQTTLDASGWSIGCLTWFRWDLNVICPRTISSMDKVLANLNITCSLEFEIELSSTRQRLAMHDVQSYCWSIMVKSLAHMKQLISRQRTNC